MDPAALLATALNADGDRLLEAGMGVADPQPHTRQGPFLQTP